MLFPSLARKVHVRLLALLAAMLVPCMDGVAAEQHSVAREWNEALLGSIKSDRARPPVHARNLFHLSAAMWDAWAAYDPEATGWLFTEKHSAIDVEAARRQAVSHAAYRLLRQRFLLSVGATTIQAKLSALMTGLGYDPTYTGKAFAGLRAQCADPTWAQAGSVVFIHSGGEPALFTGPCQGLAT